MKNKESSEKAKNIKFAIFDVDGVFTSNQILEGAPYKAKWRSYYDGQGVSLLRAVGIKVCLITNEKDDSAKGIIDVVEKWNNLPSFLNNKVRLFIGMGGLKKVQAAQEWLKEINGYFEECSYMGDDLVDADLMKKVFFRAVPVSGERVIKDKADFISERPGGSGAVRDFANFIIAAKGINPLTLPPQ